MLKSLLPLFAAAAVAAGASITADTQYDYIVVGSGPGGGPLAANLARAGHPTLLLEAGDDQGNNPNVSFLPNFNLALQDPKTRWDFYVKLFDDPALQTAHHHNVYRKTNGDFYVGTQPPAGAVELGVWYPRTGTLGGCAEHNAGVTNVPLDDDWEHLVNITGDQSFSVSNMRRLFAKMENNLYLPNGTAGHGFNGWLDVVIQPGFTMPPDSNLAAVTRELVKAVGGNATDFAAAMDRDINSADPLRDQTMGLYGMAFHADRDLNRVSPNNYVKATVAAKFPLTIQPYSLVTKVLFDSDAKSPTAIGVEVMQGESLYSADPRHVAGKKGNVTHILAAKEVIIAGGVFNTPQILKLSGIGPAAELKKFNITVVKDLPGVGENMADNYEGGIVSVSSKNMSLDAPAPYTAMMLHTPTAPGKNRNLYVFCNHFSFEGYWPQNAEFPYPVDYGNNQYECSMVHLNPKSQAGYVRLRSADPQDTPEINMRFFHDGADQDLTEMLDGIKLLRNAIYAAPGLGPWKEDHPCPGTNATCTDEQQKNFLKGQVYSHHATSSCAIGADSDPMAVLDSKFRVRGVKNLRVVDGSAFPRIPGAFPVLPTFLLAMKATDDILGTTS